MDRRFIQGTEEWLEMRRGLIMASDSPAIMGVSKWKNIHDLYNEKVNGIETKKNAAMLRGSQMEPEARSAFERVMGIFVHPEVRIKDEWLGASADGWNEEDNVLVEIKCCGEKDHLIALDDKIPPHYYPQLQHQMYVFDVEKMYYFSYRPQHEKPHALIVVERDEPYLKVWMEKVKDFYNHIQNKIPLEYEGNYSIPDGIFDDNSLEKEELLFYLMLSIKDMQFKIDRIKKELQDGFEGKSTQGKYLKFSYVSNPRGSVDYSSIPELKGVDLDPYRKKRDPYWMVNFLKSDGES